MGATGHPVVTCFRDSDSVGAVQLGEQLATILAEPLVIVSAFDYEPVALSARAVPDHGNEQRYRTAVDRMARIRRLVRSGVEVRERVVPAHRTDDALIALAAEVDAVAIILGRDVRHHVTRSVLGRARCPVIVSPFSVALGRLEPLGVVGVADDGSVEAGLARVAAERLARLTGAELRRLSPPQDPAAHLIAESEALDLLFCGSRGRGRFAGALLGSVSAELVSSAHCPVVVVPAGAAGGHDAPLGVTTAGS